MLQSYTSVSSTFIQILIEASNFMQCSILTENALRIYSAYLLLIVKMKKEQKLTLSALFIIKLMPLMNSAFNVL